ncbi:MAG: bifunctional sugar-1-phosphate nucleotidylyltransferase/acetyltransferase [Candidatus Helarchaeales archaeon]
MKTLILAGGEGRRLRPLTQNCPKPMLMIAGKPTLEHVIENLKASGLNEFYVVVGYLGDQIREYFGTGYDFGCKIEYIQQEKPENIEAAILCAKNELKDEETFMITHADFFAEPEIIQRCIETHETNEADATISVTLVENPSLYGIVKMDAEARIQCIVEKPKAGTQPSNFAASGVYIFKPEIFDILAEKKELDHAILSIIKRGGTVYSSVWEKDWVEIRYPWDLLKANSFVLNKKLLKNGSFIAKSAEISEKATISGPVYISDGVIIKSGAALQGPVYVGQNAYIGNNSLIRLNSSIGKNVMIGFGVEIRNSIIFSGTEIGRISFIGDSIIGQNVEFRAGVQTSNLPIFKKSRGEHEIMVKVDEEYLPVPLEKFGTLIGNNTLLCNNVSIHAGKTIGNDCVILPNTTIDVDIPPNKLVNEKISLEIKDLK